MYRKFKLRKKCSLRESYIKINCHLITKPMQEEIAIESLLKKACGCCNHTKKSKNYNQKWHNTVTIQK